MKTNLEDKSPQGYDDNAPLWRTRLRDDAEAGYGDPSKINNEENGSVAAPPSELSEQENDVKENTVGTKTDYGAESKLFNYREEKGIGGSFKGGAKKKIAYVAAPIIFLVLALLAIFMFVGNLKAVHFATVLRSTGFASSQLVMREAFSQTAFDAAVLTQDSVGKLDKPSQTMLDRLRGINTEKVMKDLGRDGDFKVVTDKKGNPAGFEIKGKRFMADDSAQELFGKNFKDLGPREKLTVKNKILDVTSDNLAEILSAESRSFNNSFFKGFRKYYDIRTSKWAVRAREFLGKSPDEALRLEREKAVKEINKSAPESSSIPQVDEAASATEDAMKADIKNNLNQRSKDWVNEGFKKAGVDDVASFSDTAGKVSLAVFATTIYCTARDLDKSLTAINTKKEGDAQRYAHDIQTESDQIKTGNTVQNAVTAANKTWDGNNGAPGAEESPFYLQATGRDPMSAPQSAMDGIPTAKMDNNPVHEIFSKVDLALGGGPASLVPGGTEARNKALNGVCGVALNPYAQTAVAGADVILSGLAAVASGGLTEGIKQTLKNAVVVGIGVYGGNVLGEWLDKTIRNWSGTDFSGAASGVDKYNSGAVSTDSLNSQVGRGVTFGRILSNTESKDTKTAALSNLKGRYDGSSAYERYIAINNPYSLFGRMSTFAPTTMSSMGAHAAAFPKYLLNQLGSLFSGNSMLSGLLATTGTGNKVYAATSQSFSADHNFFNVSQWGWSQSELTKLRSDPNYAILQNASWVDKNITKTESDKYQACYTGYSELSLPSDCTSEFLSTDKALHWRVNMLQSSVVDQLAGTDKSIETVGSDSSEIFTTGFKAFIRGDTSNMTCAAGTDAGVADGYRGGELVKIRLCKVQGIVVNAQIALSLDKMLTAAHSAGVNLSGGGFRTMASQIGLRNSHGCSNPSTPSSSCSPPTARPGYSNHQMGVAIDFTNCDSHGTACWQWLNANAAGFGFKNFAKEPWHWSPDGK